MKSSRKINKFVMKHKTLVSLILTTLLGCLCLFTFDEAIADATMMVKIPVANTFIGSRSVITEEAIKLIEIPKWVVFDNVIIDQNEIIGKYVKPYNAVATNSLFYNDLIVEEEKMNDAALFSLLEGEVATSIDADIKTSYANSISVGHMIDLYFLGKGKLDKENDETIVHGEIVKNVRVIAVKDKEGNSIENNDGQATAMIVVALSKENAHLVEVAKALGTVSPVISYQNLNQVEEEYYYDSMKIKNIILGNSLDVTLIPILNEEVHEE